MTDNSIDPRLKNDPVNDPSPEDQARADGRVQPTDEARELKEKQDREQIDSELEGARRAIAAAAMLDPDNEHIQNLQRELSNAYASNTSPADVERLVREAKAEEAKKETEVLAKTLFTVVGMGAAIGALWDGADYHVAQTFGAPGYSPLVNDFSGLPAKPKQAGMEILLNSGS